MEALRREPHGGSRFDLKVVLECREAVTESAMTILMAILFAFLIGPIVDDSMNGEKENDKNAWTLENGFVVKSMQCRIDFPYRESEEMFGILYPSYYPYGESFEIQGEFEVQGYWPEEAERSKRTVKIPIEFEFAPLGLESSPELLKTLRKERKFVWAKWGVDDRIEQTQSKCESDNAENVKNNDEENAEPKITRFQLPKEKDFFGSNRKTRGGFRSVKYNLEFELPAGTKVNEKIPFRFYFKPEKPPISSCFYRIGVKSPKQILTTKAGVFHHGSKLDEQRDKLDEASKVLLDKLGVPAEESKEDKQ